MCSAWAAADGGPLSTLWLVGGRRPLGLLEPRPRAMEMARGTPPEAPVIYRNLATVSDRCGRPEAATGGPLERADCVLSSDRT